jgi:hypothetical protein
MSIMAIKASTESRNRNQSLPGWQGGGKSKQCKFPRGRTCPPKLHSLRGRKHIAQRQSGLKVTTERGEKGDAAEGDLIYPGVFEQYFRKNPIHIINFRALCNTFRNK